MEALRDSEVDKIINTGIFHAEAVKDEKLWDEFKSLSLDLHLPVTESFWKMEVTKNGKVLDSKRERSASWLRNFYNQITHQTLSVDGTSAANFGAGYLSAKNISAAITATLTPFGDNGSSGFYCNYETAGFQSIRAAAGSTTHGILVGLGVTPVSFENYKIETLVANGVGGGQLSYQAMDAPINIWVGTPTFEYTMAWFRYMNNNSGGAITINEVVLQILKYVGTNAVMERHIIAGGLLVPDTAQLRCDYQMVVTFLE